MSRLRDLEIEQRFDPTRQRDIFDPSKHEHATCTMVGCGGIGSPTALALSKLGITNLVLVDNDIVEPHNVPNQLYTMEDAGGLKVDALKAHCQSFGASEITTVPKRIEECTSDEVFGMVITGLDSMEARQATWNAVKRAPSVEVLIDARIGKEDIGIYYINPMDSRDIDYYENHALYDDVDAIELGCTERAIIDVSFQVASQITRVVRKHLNQEAVPRFTAFHQGTLEKYEEVKDG